MARVRARGEDIRKFIVENIEQHKGVISSVVAAHFKITRQAVNKHFHRLVDEGCLTVTGKTRSQIYRLAPIQEWDRAYTLSPDLGEDTVWSTHVRDALGQLPDNVMDIWNYAFTEMFNNALDHSGSETAYVKIAKTAATVEMVIHDRGRGIFRKIQEELGLLDERHAILELSKGKLTTDPRRHSGEGIFFTSRMVDQFDILSGGVFLSHQFGKEEEHWILERNEARDGTSVYLKLHNHTARRLTAIFDQYSSGADDYGFTKTVVPVRLAQYGNDKLISRSQAKRILARVELFKTVMFDFTDVPTIGQAFADEIFRVFPLQHPSIRVHPMNENSAVKRMIARAKHGLHAEPAPAEPADAH
jgi:anti-sigma regulatory factor (Ser/Thr protein kinase)